MQIYEKINNKTWGWQIILFGIIFWIDTHNGNILNFIRQFKIDPYLLLAILGIINCILIRLTVLVLSCLIYLFQRKD